MVSDETWDEIETDFDFQVIGWKYDGDGRVVMVEQQSSPSKGYQAVLLEPNFRDNPVPTEKIAEGEDEDAVIVDAERWMEEYAH